jgi:hypothetical protein
LKSYFRIPLLPLNVDVPKWFKGADCKSVIHQFESDHRLYMLSWWNWDTRMLEGHMPKGLRVRVPPITLNASVGELEDPISLKDIFLNWECEFESHLEHSIVLIYILMFYFKEGAELGCSTRFELLGIE